MRPVLVLALLTCPSGLAAQGIELPKGLLSRETEARAFGDGTTIFDLEQYWRAQIHYRLQPGTGADQYVGDLGLNDCEPLYPARPPSDFINLWLVYDHGKTRLSAAYLPPRIHHYMPPIQYRGKDESGNLAFYDSGQRILTLLSNGPTKDTQSEWIWYKYEDLTDDQLSKLFVDWRPHVGVLFYALPGLCKFDLSQEQSFGLWYFYQAVVKNAHRWVPDGRRQK
jgi:hypothetical protein